jgi:hypothetical protein
MIYQDRIYGKIKIEEPVILELIKSPSLQRLKGISQGAHSPIFFKILKLPFRKCQVFRFEHSLGVFILLKIFGASLKEQISGLIHDVSMPVFSHSIDYVLKEGSEIDQSFQDKIHEKFINDTEIPKILKKFGFELKTILDDKNFPLKERPLPELCADRIDYSIRDGVAYGVISKEKAQGFIKNLCIVNNRWVFKNKNWAENFAKFYKKMNDKFYSGIASALMFRTIGDLISYSLSVGIISKNDLFTSDAEVLKKIKKYRKKDKKLNLLFKRTEGKIKFKLDKNDYNAHCFCKSRVVDPLFLTKDGIKKLSKVNKDWEKIIQKGRKPREYFIKFYD